MLIISESGIYKYLDKLSGGDKKTFTKYQQVIIKYFTSDEFKKNILLLLYMEVGTGKTLTSLACGIEAIKRKLFKRIVILSPKSVQNEFEQNLKLYYELTQETDISKYNNIIYMIPYNANNSQLQLSKLGNLEHSLFIIDEAHLFMKSVIKVNLVPTDKQGNDEKISNIGNAKKIYDKISRLKNKKVICLTGTPSAKHPFETVPMFNLAGCNFPDTYTSFIDKYVDTDKNKIKNKNEIISRIHGLVAYVKSDSSAQKLKSSQLKVIEVEMSKSQYQQYLIDYEKEVNEKAFTNKRNIFGIPFGSKSSFHAKTFEDSIYWNESLTNLINDKNRYIGKIIVDKIHCPKIIKMFDDTKYVNGTCVFYFRFVRMYGTDTMVQKLKEEGYELASTNENKVFSEKKKRFVLFTGDISFSTRNKWKKYFNDKRNMYGNYIKYLILSPSGSVGITLKNVRFLGIGSVEFNYSMVRQILGRVNRLNSHIDLPQNERTLINNIYISTKNKFFYRLHKKEINKLCSRKAPGHNEIAPTIERIIYQDSIQDDELNEDFRDCLIKSSINI